MQVGDRQREEWTGQPAACVRVGGGGGSRAWAACDGRMGEGSALQLLVPQPIQAAAEIRSARGGVAPR
eukprot:scaffold37146_cov67-Phaeocystis_antarctica.AAC.8